MPKFIKIIQGEVIKEVSGPVAIASFVIAEIQNTDYIDMNNFTAYIQNLSQAITYKDITKPVLFGLQMYKASFGLEISY